MNLTSKAFENGKQISTRYTCDGEDIHPPLEISNAPRGTKSYCILMEDLDAKDQSGANYLHWSIWNIPPKTTSIQEAKVPRGATQGKTSSGSYRYAGPCPPSDTSHRYRFRLFALGKILEISPDSDVEEIEDEISDAIISEAELYGTYDRNGRTSWPKHTQEELGAPPESSRIPPEAEPEYETAEEELGTPGDRSRVPPEIRKEYGIGTEEEQEEESEEEEY